MLQASFASCSSRLHILWGLWCMVLETYRTMKLPQHKLSHKSRHARTNCDPCLWRVTPRQTHKCPSMHPSRKWMLCLWGMGPKKESYRVMFGRQYAWIYNSHVQGCVMKLSKPQRTWWHLTYEKTLPETGILKFMVLYQWGQ